jgi:uncharacterized damage-inducible protein DinB
MAIVDAIIQEMEMEAKKTRLILQKVPTAQFSWKPHEKSMTLQRLANHIAELPEWATLVAATSDVDFATHPFVRSEMHNTEDLLNHFDKCMSLCISAVSALSDGDLASSWTMRRGENVIMTTTKADILRTWVINHTLHHRGQLSVYLRLLDIPVPGLYGPSADDK